MSYDFSQYNVPKSIYTNTGSVPKTSKLGASDYVGIGTTLFNGVASYMGSKELTKTQKIQAQSLAEQGNTQLEIAKIMLETERVKLGKAKDSNFKVGGKTVYIALGVGAVIILGTVIFAVTRKK